MMNITIENATVYIAIIMFVVGIVRCVLVAPIKDSIAGLQKCIEKLEMSLSILDEKLDSQRERIALVESSASSAHRRIDRIDHMVDGDKQSYD